MDMKQETVVAFIPAKMTSIRTPKKNAALLGDKPLFMHSVDTAASVPEISAAYVSTESDEIEALADTARCTVLRRNPALSHPEIPNRDVITATIEQITEIGDQAPDIIAMLQPTHPFRCSQMLSKAIERFRQTPEASSLFAVRQITKAHGQIEDGWWTPSSSLKSSANVDADAKRLYTNTGNFYLFRVAETFAKGTYFGDRILPFELDFPMIDVDIDYPWDLEFARALERVGTDILFNRATNQGSET